MSNNTNTLFWIITGAVIVLASFLLINLSNNDSISKIFDKFGETFNSLKESSVLKKYYGHELNYNNFVITDESEFVFNEETKEITGYIGNKTEIVVPYEINNVFVEKISNIGDSIYNSQNGMCDMEKEMYLLGDSNIENWKNYALQRNFVVDEKGNCITLNSLTKVVIPNTVKVIGNYAFYNQKLTSVIIPDSVVEIGDLAFRDNQITGEYVISKNIETIGYDAFFNNQLTAINFNKADNLKKIGPEAFMMNKISNKLTFSSNIEEINTGAFSYNKIQEIDFSLATKLISIDYNCFSNNLLTTVTISSNIVQIMNNAFANNSLETIELLGTNTTVWTDAFYNNESLHIIKVPRSVLDFYKSQLSLSNFVIIGS